MTNSKVRRVSSFNVTRTILLVGGLLATMSLSAWESAAAENECPLCAAMELIPAGTFSMGSPDAETERSPDEPPVHVVSIDHAFWLGRYDVTRSEYGRFVRETGYSAAHPRCDWQNPTFKGKPLNQGGDEPVVCVSWNDANAYTSWLSHVSGRHFRFPSEAEWEYAARAGTTTARPWGEGDIRDFANTGAEACCAPFAEGRDRWLFTSPVGSFPPNRFGLYDMLGNVWQWTADCAADNDTPRPPALASAPANCAARVVRGGGWFHPPQMARSAQRVADSPDLRVGDIGFRVALSQ